MNQHVRRFARVTRRLIHTKTGVWIQRRGSELSGSTFEYPLADWLSAIAASVERPLSVVQLGAFDGLSWDPLPGFLRSGQHRVTLVEPNPGSSDELKHVYQHNRLSQILPCAVMPSEREDVVLWTFRDDLSDEYPDFLGTSSLELDHMREAFLRNAYRFPSLEWSTDLLERHACKCMTLKQVLEAHGQSTVDCLLMDLEGLDHAIISTLADLSWRPTLVQIESRFMNARQYEDVLIMMRRLGYNASMNREDTLFVRQT